jgi:quercetin dioxygenase-like cupin family protein
MRKRLTWLVLLSTAILFTALYHAKKVQATPGEGFVSTTLAVGRFGEIDVFNHFIPPDSRHDHHNRDIWLSWQRTKGTSDLYVQSNVWQPGGSTGWHSHPGHSLIVVTAGTVTAYEGDDPDCKPHVYTQGMGFVDPGAGHVHIVRNEGTVEARTVAVQLIRAHPDGTSSAGDRRIDVADPGNCHF